MLSTLLKKIHGHLVGQHDFPTLFGEASVYSIPDEEDRSVRVLAVDGVLQSATYLDERWALCPFEYLRGFDHLEALLAEQGRTDDLRIFIEDGEEFLQECTNSYDAIIIDAFAGREDVSYFRTDDGIAATKGLLMSGGLLVFNCVIEYAGNDMYRLYRFVEGLRLQFANVTVIDASDEQFGGADNYLVVASDGIYPFTNVIPYD